MGEFVVFGRRDCRCFIAELLVDVYTGNSGSDDDKHVNEEGVCMV